MLRDVIGHEDVKGSLKKITFNIPKVLLFTGPSGVGKKFTALNFIDEVNNGYITKKLFTHPDIFILDPQGKTFKLELVDKMKSYMSTTPFELSKKFFILNNIELMNKESANACLKIFEDVPEHIQIILLSDHYDNVIDTLKSRSVNFSFSPIKNLKNYYPSLNALQIKVISGCPGKINEIIDVDLDTLYKESIYFIKYFSNLNYWEIIDWCVSKESYDLSLLNKIMFIAVEDIFLEKEKNVPFDHIIHALKNIQERSSYTVNSKTHLRSCLLEARYNLSKIN
jgi:hypothetical protein